MPTLPPFMKNTHNRLLTFVLVSQPRFDNKHMRSFLTSRRSVSGWGHVTHGARALQPNGFRFRFIPRKVPGSQPGGWVGEFLRLLKAPKRGRPEALQNPSNFEKIGYFGIAAKVPDLQRGASAFSFKGGCFYRTMGSAEGPCPWCSRF